LKHDTGLDYEIHVIAEIGQQGSILSLLSDSTGHVGNDENQLHLPAADISNLFFYYNANRLAKFGYMTNSPGELTGKLSNHVSVIYNKLIDIRLHSFSTLRFIIYGF
jgi:hypothetical protein